MKIVTRNYKKRIKQTKVTIMPVFNISSSFPIFKLRFIKKSIIVIICPKKLKQKKDEKFKKIQNIKEK